MRTSDIISIVVLIISIILFIYIYGRILNLNTNFLSGAGKTPTLFKRIKDMYESLYFTPSSTNGVLQSIQSMIYNFNTEYLHHQHNQAFEDIDTDLEPDIYNEYINPYLEGIVHPELRKILPSHIFAKNPNKLVLTYDDVKKSEVHKVKVEYYIELPLTEVQIPGKTPYYRNSYVKIMVEGIGKKIPGKIKYTADGLRYRTISNDGHFIVFDTIFHARNAFGY